MLVRLKAKLALAILATPSLIGAHTPRATQTEVYVITLTGIAETN